MSRILGFALASVGILAALSVAGQAGGSKPPAWKPFLPESAYAALTKRSMERIGRLAKDEKAPLTQLHAEALILAGYTRSIKDSPDVAPLRLTAMFLAMDTVKKNKAGARVVAADLAAGKLLLEVKPAPPKELTAVIGDIKDVMMVFATKAKGGEGIPADLQYNAKVKNQNGIEALINALAAKKLTDKNAAKMSKELELLGYRTAVIGALTLERGPADKKADAKVWNEQSVEMRDSAIALAEAAKKKDGPAIFDASKRLENSCVECHGSYK